MLRSLCFIHKGNVSQKHCLCGIIAVIMIECYLITVIYMGEQ